jgi:hypothetical protein
VSTSSLHAGAEVGVRVNYGVGESRLGAVEIREAGMVLASVKCRRHRTHKPESNPLGPTPPTGGGQTAPEKLADVTESERCFGKDNISRPGTPLTVARNAGVADERLIYIH